MSDHDGASDRRGPLPPVLFLGSLVLQWGLHAFLPATQLVPSRWAIIAAVPILVGLALAVFADRQFKAVSTAIKPFDRPSVLVTTGPFAVSRNPMYLSMELILLGAALAWGSLTPFLVVPAFALLLTKRFIAAEEAALHEVFGTDYDEYRRRVRRWI